MIDNNHVAHIPCSSLKDQQNYCYQIFIELLIIKVCLLPVVVSYIPPCKQTGIVISNNTTKTLRNLLLFLWDMIYREGFTIQSCLNDSPGISKCRSVCVNLAVESALKRNVTRHNENVTQDFLCNALYLGMLRWSAVGLRLIVGFAW